MKICAISDTHSYHRQVVVPEADVLIHAGDITWKGELPIVEDFAKWLKDIQIPHKIIIWGNHEVGFERGYKRDPAIKVIQDAGAIYLEDSGVEIDGIKFWGSPIQPFFFDWEFNRQRGQDIKVHWDKIPTTTNVLITHGPAYGILDEAPRGSGMFDHVGCQDLLNRINELPQLKAHIAGHIHNGHSPVPVIINGVKFINASVCTENYKPTNLPVVFEV
jgi:Icc-related predicted phosphoesterase